MRKYKITYKLYRNGKTLRATKILEAYSIASAREVFKEFKDPDLIININPVN